MITSPSRRWSSCGQRLSLLLVGGSLLATGCLGSGGTQVGTNTPQTTAAPITAPPTVGVSTVSVPPAVATTPATTTAPTTPGSIIGTIATAGTAPGGGPTTTLKGQPVLTAVAPSSGKAGDKVTLTGSAFFSRDGVISAHFGATAAFVACQSTTSCTVTVPSQPAGTAATPVTITTETGTSQAVPFTYTTGTAPTTAPPPPA